MTSCHRVDGLYSRVVELHRVTANGWSLYESREIIEITCARWCGKLRRHWIHSYATGLIESTYCCQLGFNRLHLIAQSCDLCACRVIRAENCSVSSSYIHHGRTMLLYAPLPLIPNTSHSSTRPCYPTGGAGAIYPARDWCSHPTIFHPLPVYQLNLIPLHGE